MGKHNSYAELGAGIIQFQHRAFLPGHNAVSAYVPCGRGVFSSEKIPLDSNREKA